MILTSITTTQENGNSWQEKIKEIKKFNIKQIAFFPTAMNKKQRQIIYKELSKLNDLEIPFVHIRNDFDEKEVEFLIKKFKTKILNVHSSKEYPVPNIGKYNKMLCLENTWSRIDDEIENYFGICLDYAHLESQRIEKNILYKYFRKLMKKYKVTCAHIGIIKDNKAKTEFINGVGKITNYHYHYYEKLEEFDYLKHYKKLLPKIIALEIENSIEEQLIAKKYIQKLLK